MLYDAHCHLDFSTDPAKLAAGLRDEAVFAVSATVTPAGFERAVAFLESSSNVHVGLGFHPWWVSDGRLALADVDEFEAFASGEKLLHISEVGLDFAPKRLAASVSGGVAESEDAARLLQMDALEAVLSAADIVPGRYISLHSVRAEKEALDILGASGMADRHACVFHGYAGSQEQLFRLLDMGCYVSVGPRMLSTKRGREYVKALPAERILLETDSPSSPGESFSAMRLKASLEESLESIAGLRGLNADRRDALHAQIAETSRCVLCF